MTRTKVGLRAGEGVETEDDRWKKYKKNKKRKSYNLKKTVGSACDTGAAAAPNLLLLLFHFYPPLKRRVSRQCLSNK